MTACDNLSQECLPTYFPKYEAGALCQTFKLIDIIEQPDMHPNPQV